MSALRISYAVLHCSKKVICADTIITWTEASTGAELALSFQGPAGKDHVWSSLQAYKQKLLMEAGEAGAANSSNASSAATSSATVTDPNSEAGEAGNESSENAAGSSALTGSAAFGRRAGSFMDHASDSECEDDDFRMYGGSDFGVAKELPKPVADLDSLHDLLRMVEDAVNSLIDRDPLSTRVTQDDSAWLQKLGKVFVAAEMNAQYEQCEAVYNIMRQLALASTRQLLATLTSDTFWPLLVAAFEYDRSSAAAASSLARAGSPSSGSATTQDVRSGTPMPHDNAGEGGSLPGTPVAPAAAAAAPPTVALPATASSFASSAAATGNGQPARASQAAVRPHHRRFLRNVKFRTAVALHDEDIAQTIHQTFRLQFLRDVLLPCALDHSFVGTVTSMISENHMTLVAHFAQDEQYIARLLAVLHDNKQRNKRRHSILTRAVHRSRRHGSAKHQSSKGSRGATPSSRPVSPVAGPVPTPTGHSSASMLASAMSTPQPAAAASTPGSAVSTASSETGANTSPAHDRISRRAQALPPVSPTYPVQTQDSSSSQPAVPGDNITPALVSGGANGTSANEDNAGPSVQANHRAAVSPNAVVLPDAAAPVAASIESTIAAPAASAAVATTTSTSTVNTTPATVDEQTSVPSQADTGAPAVSVPPPLDSVELPPLSTVQAPPPPASNDSRDAMKFLKELTQAALKHATMNDKRDLFATLLRPVERGDGSELFLLDVFAPVLADRTAGVEEVQTALDVLIAIMDAEPDTVRAYMLRQHEDPKHIPPKLDADMAAGGGDNSSSLRLSSSQLREVSQGEHGHLLQLWEDDLGSNKAQLDAEGKPPAGCCYSNVSLLYCLIWRLLEDPDVGVQGLAADAIRSLWDPDRLPCGELHDFLSMFYDHYMPLLVRPFTHPQLAPIPTVPTSQHILSLMRRTGASSAGAVAGRPLRRPRALRRVVVDVAQDALPSMTDSSPIRVASNAATVGAPEDDESASTGGVKRARSYESDHESELPGSKTTEQDEEAVDTAAGSSPPKRRRFDESGAQQGKLVDIASNSGGTGSSVVNSTPVQVKLEPLSSSSGSAPASSAASVPGAGAAPPPLAGAAAGDAVDTSSTSSSLSLADMMAQAGRLGQESSCSKHSKLLLCGLLTFALEHHTHRIKYFLVRQNVAVKIMRLVYYPERHMQLVGIRFQRAVMGLNDPFYHRLMARLSLFGHVLWALAANGSMSNLVNSAVLESLHYVANENIEILIKDLTNKYSTVLKEVTYSRAPAAILSKARRLARGQQLRSANATSALGDYGTDENDSDGAPAKAGTAAAMRASRGTALSSGDSLGSGGPPVLFGRRSLLARSAQNRTALSAGHRSAFDDVDEDEDGDSDLVGSSASGHSADSDGDSTPLVDDGSDLMADLDDSSSPTPPAPAPAPAASSLAPVPDDEMAQMLSAALRGNNDDSGSDDDDDLPFGRSKLVKPNAGGASGVPRSAPSALTLASQSIFSQVSQQASSMSTMSSADSTVASASTSGIMSGPQISITIQAPPQAAATAPASQQPVPGKAALVEYGQGED